MGIRDETWHREMMLYGPYMAFLEISYCQVVEVAGRQVGGVCA